MKKIALLLTITCIGALNGIETLPKDTQRLILNALNTGDDLRSIIQTIQALSVTNKALNQMVNKKYGNPTGFRDLMQTLAKKFPERDTETIAKAFETPAAKNYLDLGEKLINLLLSAKEQHITDVINEINKLVANGADVNFMKCSGYRPLELISFGLTGLDEPEAKQLIQVLYNHGAVDSEEATKRILQTTIKKGAQTCTIS